MLFIILIWVYTIINVYGFIPEDTSKVIQKDTNYKIDLLIQPEDYEIIDKNQMDFGIDGREQEFSALDKIASVKYDEAMQSKKMKTENFPKDFILPLLVINSDNRNIMTTLRPVPSTSTHMIQKRDTKQKETEYNYNSLIDEYFEDTDNDLNSNKTYYRESDVPHYGLINSLKAILLLETDDYKNADTINGSKAIKSFVRDYRSQRHFTIEATERIWRVAKIWSLLYIVFAVPLWCTRGWCCCCLFCKFFNPRETIEEAKKYIILNPPGVYKTKTGEVRYEPTEREKELYEEFEHYIKTL